MGGGGGKKYRGEGGRKPFCVGGSPHQVLPPPLFVAPPLWRSLGFVSVIEGSGFWIDLLTGNFIRQERLVVVHARDAKFGRAVPDLLCEPKELGVRGCTCNLNLSAPSHRICNR